MIFLLLVWVALFSYEALNAGEHRLYRPGIGRPLTIVLIVALAWLLWPVYASFVTWAIPVK